MTSATASPRLAVNPIPYWLAGGTVDRSTKNLAKAFEELSAIGYQAVKADVPSDMAAERYLPWLESFGLKPALSLYSGVFSNRETHKQAAEDAKKFAAVQASLGQEFAMISTVDRDGGRWTYPGVGHDFDDERLRVIVDGVRTSAEAMRAEGVKAALHPHVGGWIETEHEIRTVLDEVGPDLLAFGPDTGHMSWAGMDVAGVIADYSDRVIGVHLKDTLQAGIQRAKADKLSYVEATRPGGIWAEPGTGQLDLLACVRAFPAGFAGDYMIEVDVPTIGLKECHRIAFDWANANLQLSK